MMTTAILIAIIWAFYAAWAIKQTNWEDWPDDGEIEAFVTACIMLAPLVFVAKAIYGAFKQYK